MGSGGTNKMGQQAFDNKGIPIPTFRYIEDYIDNQISSGKPLVLTGKNDEKVSREVKIGAQIKKMAADFQDDFNGFLSGNLIGIQSPDDFYSSRGKSVPNDTGIGGFLKIPSPLSGNPLPQSQSPKEIAGSNNITVQKKAETKAGADSFVPLTKPQKEEIAVVEASPKKAEAPAKPLTETLNSYFRIKPRSSSYARSTSRRNGIPSPLKKQGRRNGLVDRKQGGNRYSTAKSSSGRYTADLEAYRRNNRILDSIRKRNLMQQRLADTRARQAYEAHIERQNKRFALENAKLAASQKKEKKKEHGEGVSRYLLRLARQYDLGGVKFKSNRDLLRALIKNGADHREIGSNLRALGIDVSNVVNRLAASGQSYRLGEALRRGLGATSSRIGESYINDFLGKPNAALS